MKGDFTRDTFYFQKHYLRVLKQQGRVDVDADPNEQTSILLHYLQALAADLIGPFAGPMDGSFLIQAPTDNSKLDFWISPGHYYVDGLLCENDRQYQNGQPVNTDYANQPYSPLPDDAKLAAGVNYLVYLDVWERHITYIQDDHIREAALGGPDTSTRSQLVWQAKVANKMPDGGNIGDPNRDDIEKLWPGWVQMWQPARRGLLRAKAKDDSAPTTDPCIQSPDARYRGAENQLYRVEIHDSGKAGQATFKWSRDNGTVVFPIDKLEITSDSSGTATTLTVSNLGRDDRFGLTEGDWVEIVDDSYELQGRAEPLLRVTKVDPLDLQVTLAGGPASKVGQDQSKHPLLRRWDQKQVGDITLQDGVIPIEEDRWYLLEDGVQVCFEPVPVDQENQFQQYRTGDYWYIPARVVTGNVEWPQEKDSSGNLGPAALPPHGVEHHYAPLAIVATGADGAVTLAPNGDLRRILKPIWG